MVYLKKRVKRKIIDKNLIFIYLILIVSLVQQMPLIKDYFYQQMRFALYILVLICIFRTIATKRISITNIPIIIKLYIFFLVLFFGIIIIIALFGSKTNFFDTNLQLISLFIIFISFYNFIDEKNIKHILYIYTIIATILSVSSVMYYGRGLFVISTTYTVDFKAGPSFAALYAIIISFFEIMNSKKILKLSNFFFLFVMFINYSSIFSMKSRSALIGSIIGIIFILILNLKIKKIFIILFCIISITLIILSIIGITPIKDIFEKSIFEGYENNIDSISTGRVSGYKKALEFISNNLYFGELYGKGWYYNTRPHNYILNNWVKYGVFISFPLIALFLFLFVFSLKSYIFIFKEKIRYKSSVCIIMLLVSFMISMIEYTLPFGPGTLQFIIWLLLGQFLIRKNAYKESLKNIEAET